MKYVTAERLLEITCDHFGIMLSREARTMFENYAKDLENEIIKNATDQAAGGAKVTQNVTGAEPVPTLT